MINVDQKEVEKIYEADYKRLGKERLYKMRFKVTYKGYTAKVFRYELYKLFEIDIPISPKGTFYDGKKFIPFYVAGYKKGIKFFNEKYKIDPDTLFRHSDEYFKELKPWLTYINRYPAQFYSDKTFSEYGYYAGINSEIENIQLHYPGSFEKIKKGPSHRVLIFVNRYKAKVGEEKYKTAADWYKERGGRSKLQFGTTLKKEPTKTELKKIIELLEGSIAQKIAINDLDILKNSYGVTYP